MLGCKSVIDSSDNNISTSNYLNSGRNNFNSEKSFNSINIGLDSTKSTFNDEKIISNVQVFPNPATNNINIAFSLENPSNCNLIIFDLDGRKVRQENFNGSGGLNIHETDISQLSSGSYILTIQTENDYYRKNIVVSH